MNFVREAARRNDVLKIAICDDEEYPRTLITKYVHKYFQTINEEDVFVRAYSSGKEFLYSNLRFDIVFMDIMMPGLDGINTALRLREWDVNSKIIYVTNYNNHIDHAYKVRAFGYIIKPVVETEIIGVLAEAIRYIKDSKPVRKCTFETEEGIVRLNPEDIYYVEYYARQAFIQTKKRKYSLLKKYALKDLATLLKDFNFTYSHQSFLVNMNYVVDIKKDDSSTQVLILEDGFVIQLAQKRASGFRKEFNAFLQSTFDRI